MKIYPRREGNRNVGIAAKRRESEFATPYADATSGPVRRNVSSADGALSARIG